MSAMEMKDEVEIEEFTDELSDEAIDRADSRVCVTSGGNRCVCDYVPITDP